TMERITINALGRSRTVLEELVREAQIQFAEKDRCRTVIYSADQYGGWRRTRSRPIRPLNTIMLDGGLKSSILNDVREFLGSEKYYADRGIPYRRGYMFYGSPGTGKTSFVTALAGELKLNIYVISLANKGLSDETLTELMVDSPARCILLLEDIDAAFVSRSSALGSVVPSGASAATPATTTIVTNVTFSGLLNAIDGVAAQEGRILCMTTNHLEALDPALIRPGRVDVRVLFDRATRQQARDLFVQFFPHGEPPANSAPTTTLTSAELESLADEFARQIPDKKFSMAQIQGFLMKWKNSPRDAKAFVGELVGSGLPAVEK
ncbi:mitochondrial chaperone BCS1, partial [Blyttiomyces helicus]